MPRKTETRRALDDAVQGPPEPGERRQQLSLLGEDGGGGGGGEDGGGEAGKRGPYRKTTQLAEYLQARDPAGRAPALLMWDRANATIDRLLGEYGLPDTAENRRFCAVRQEAAAAQLAEFVHSKQPRDVRLQGDGLDVVRIIMTDPERRVDGEVVSLDGSDMVLERLPGAERAEESDAGEE